MRGGERTGYWGRWKTVLVNSNNLGHSHLSDGRWLQTTEPHQILAIALRIRLEVVTKVGRAASYNSAGIVNDVQLYLGLFVCANGSTGGSMKYHVSRTTVASCAADMARPATTVQELSMMSSCTWGCLCVRMAAPEARWGTMCHERRSLPAPLTWHSTVSCAESRWNQSANNTCRWPTFTTQASTGVKIMVNGSTATVPPHDNRNTADDHALAPARNKKVGWHCTQTVSHVHSCILPSKYGQRPVFAEVTDRQPIATVQDTSSQYCFH